MQSREDNLSGFIYSSLEMSADSTESKFEKELGYGVQKVGDCQVWRNHV